MGRGYTREAYLELVEHIKELIPGWFHQNFRSFFFFIDLLLSQILPLRAILSPDFAAKRTLLTKTLFH